MAEWVLLLPLMHWSYRSNLLHAHIETNYEHYWEFVKSKAWNEEPTKKKDQGKSDIYELRDEEEDRRLANKFTLSINCIYRGQEVPKGKKSDNLKPRKGLRSP